MTSDSRPRTTRRGVLRSIGAVGAAGAGGLAVVPTAGAQITINAVISAAEEFADDYAGLFVHVGELSTGELQVEAVEDCDIDGWPPDGFEAYNGSLIDKKGDDPVTSIPAEVYVPVGWDVSTGSLFVVNRQHDCPEGYVGLELEQIGASSVEISTATQGTATPEPTASDGGSASGPGFGVAGTLAGVGGLAGLTRLLRGDREG